jgi:hypothetical protein
LEAIKRDFYGSHSSYRTIDLRIASRGDNNLVYAQMCLSPHPNGNPNFMFHNILCRNIKLWKSLLDSIEK